MRADSDSCPPMRLLARLVWQNGVQCVLGRMVQAASAGVGGGCAVLQRHLSGANCAECGYFGAAWRVSTAECELAACKTLETERVQGSLPENGEVTEAYTGPKGTNFPAGLANPNPLFGLDAVRKVGDYAQRTRHQGSARACGGLSATQFSLERACRRRRAVIRPQQQRDA